MIVVGIIAILALMAMPSFQGKIIKDQIIEGSALAAVAKGPVGAYWALTKTMPPDNASLALPEAEKIVSNMVRAVTVKAGAIHITFGNQANGLLKNKTLSLRPAIVDDAPVVPVAWVCAFAPAPANMTVQGENKTDIPREYLPLNCR